MVIGSGPSLGAPTPRVPTPCPGIRRRAPSIARPSAGVDAAINLSGSTIATRWTAEKKREIHDSRVNSTRVLAEALASLPVKPRVMISASAVGYYGDRGDEVLTEASTPGSDFLGTVCVEWEQAAQPAVAAGIRVVHPRLGLVLSPAGGLLREILRPFRAGVGGPIGTGKQWWSWIVLHDALSAIRHMLVTESVSGPVNTVSPQPVRNEAFAEFLGTVLNRPAAVPVPAFALRLIFGEAAEGAILTGARASCEKLQATGFRFGHPTLEAALRHLLT